jgi:hypothetical protein
MTKIKSAHTHGHVIQITTMSGLVFQGIITEVTEFYATIFDALDNWAYEIDFSDMQKIRVTCD